MAEENLNDGDAAVGRRQTAGGRKTLPTAHCPLSTALRPRCRFLRVVAAVAPLPPIIATVRATAPNARLHSWHGEVLGAVSELSLWHPDAAFARRTILRVRHEIERFERIFSLY